MSTPPVSIEDVYKLLEERLANLVNEEDLSSIITTKFNELEQQLKENLKSE